MPAVALRYPTPGFPPQDPRRSDAGAHPPLHGILHSWACCVFSGLDFVYVYGARADCARLSEVHRGTTLHKGEAQSLERVQGLAEEAAAQLQGVYDGVGTARAMPVREFLFRRYGLQLDAGGRVLGSDLRTRCHAAADASPRRP